jgi:DNA-binding MarR family transcriptional regulator
MQNNIAFLTSDVSRLLRKRFDVVSRRFGVTGPQWRMLAALRRTPGVNQGALAQWLEVEAITAGRMIDRLEKSGMVERRADPHDRRAWRLFLTDAATPLLDELFICATDVFEEALQGFDVLWLGEIRNYLYILLERCQAGGGDPVAQEIQLGDGEDTLVEVEGEAVGSQDGEQLAEVAPVVVGTAAVCAVVI